MLQSMPDDVPFEPRLVWYPLARMCVFRRWLRRSAALVTTLCLTLSPGSSHASARSGYLAGFPLLRQQHPLTCEASAASMGTRGRVGEDQLMAVIPRNPNPNLGFRGQPDGTQDRALTEYGVYANPLHAALQRFGYSSDVITYGSDAQIRSYINRGWPVVAWITYALVREKPRLGAANGVQFILVPREHAVLIVGYNNGAVIANDPWTQKRVWYNWRAFNRSWGYFGNMALAMQSCAAPAPIAEIRADASSPGSVVWSWSPPARAVRYRVVLTRSGLSGPPVFQGYQYSTQFTTNAPPPGTGYQLSVAPIAACGAVTAGASAWFWAPRPPTITPMPSPTPVEATVTSTSTPTPGARSAPTPMTVVTRATTPSARS